MSRRVVVRVPGVRRDSADATDLWLSASFELDASRLRRVERGGRLRALEIPDDEDLLIIGARAACHAAGVALPDALRARVVSEIPIGEGRGASAAAVLAGILGARELLGLALDEASVERLATSIDHSPEQVRASIVAHTVAVYPACDDAPPPRRERFADALLRASIEGAGS